MINLSNNADSRMFILPESARGLVDVLKRAVRARKVRWNHMVVWKDVNGWGVSLAVAEWVSSQPNSRAAYIND